MTESVLILRIAHERALPEGFAQVMEQRAHDYILAKGIKCGEVSATQCTQVPAKPEKWEIHHG